MKLLLRIIVVNIENIIEFPNRINDVDSNDSIINTSESIDCALIFLKKNNIKSHIINDKKYSIKLPKILKLNSSQSETFGNTINIR